MPERRVARSLSPFEKAFGFVRALALEDRVLVAGTAPIGEDGTVEPDPAAQARRCFAIAAAALEELGSGLEETVRTRMYIVDPADAPAIGAVHGELFSKNPPVATMVVVAGLLDEAWKVEIELEAASSRAEVASPPR